MWGSFYKSRWDTKVVCINAAIGLFTDRLGAVYGANSVVSAYEPKPRKQPKNPTIAHELLEIKRKITLLENTLTKAKQWLETSNNISSEEGSEDEDSIAGQYLSEQ